MAIVPAFHSIKDANKPIHKRVYHNNNRCSPGRDIPLEERGSGTRNYRLCDDCKSLNDRGR